ncbi:unnamed protein product [Parnassius apollo]|uniref:(apollo) hypothetical protein n=1 Tax=Parnassius apollo TaxID=110799 RepID=A0A8S3W204_PARAO|nr:unnamed protein product [Parnassius apollo]
MLTARQSSSFDASASSSVMESYGDTDTIIVKNYVKDLLKSRIFLGRYLERRLISQRTSYRDIVLLSAAEIELKRDLLEVQTKLRNVCTDQHWIGITSSEFLGYNTGVCIWTEIDNQPFGAFWFQIKSIKFRADEVMLTLKCIRHISDSFLELEPILTGAIKNSVENTETKFDNSLESLKESYDDIVHNLKSAISIKNLKEFVTFLFAFVIAVFTGSTAFVNFLGNFILALIREMSVLIKNSTPMFLGVLDFFSKIIGGFYILLAMFFKPNTPVRINKRTLTYNDQPPLYNHYNSRDFD